MTRSRAGRGEHWEPISRGPWSFGGKASDSRVLLALLPVGLLHGPAGSGLFFHGRVHCSQRGLRGFGHHVGLELGKIVLFLFL